MIPHEVDDLERYATQRTYPQGLSEPQVKWWVAPAWVGFAFIAGLLYFAMALYKGE
jgi:hypothetical protein